MCYIDFLVKGDHPWFMVQESARIASSRRDPSLPLVLFIDGQSTPDLLVSTDPSQYGGRCTSEVIQNGSRYNTYDLTNSAICSSLSIYGLDVVLAARLHRISETLQNQCKALLFHPHFPQVGKEVADFLLERRHLLSVLLYATSADLQGSERLSGWNHLYQVDDDCLGVLKTDGIFELGEYLSLQLRGRIHSVQSQDKITR